MQSEDQGARLLSLSEAINRTISQAGITTEDAIVLLVGAVALQIQKVVDNPIDLGLVLDTVSDQVRNYAHEAFLDRL